MGPSLPRLPRWHVCFPLGDPLTAVCPLYSLEMSQHMQKLQLNPKPVLAEHRNVPNKETVLRNRMALDIVAASQGGT